MSVEVPQPEPKKKKRVPRLVEHFDEQGWLSGKAHLEVIRKIDCSCESHKYDALMDLFRNGKTTAEGLTETFTRYADINLKYHNSNREAGWMTPSQEAEKILFEHNKNEGKA